MSETNMTRISLSELRQKKDRGEIPPITAKAGEDLGPNFWANARRVDPVEPRSVRLNLDPEVFDYFKSLGKGHLTRMQNVLKAYAEAHMKGPAR